MSREQIITELYKSKDVDDCISKMVVHDLRADFKQELFIIISETNESLLRKLKSANNLKYYVVRIIINLSRQKRNVFHRTYLNTSITYSDNFKEPSEEMNIEERRLQEQKEIELINRIHNLDLDLNSPAYRLMVLLVNRFGSQSEVSRRTGIPVCVISRGIKKVRQHLCS